MNKRRRYLAKRRRAQRNAWDRLSPLNKWMLSPDGMERMDVLIRESTIDISEFLKAAFADGQASA
jgi:hypothetical protein